MKTAITPSLLILATLIASLTSAANTVWAGDINGLSKCLVYTVDGTHTTMGRSRPDGEGTPVYSQSASKSYGLLVVGPRKIEKAQHYDYNSSGELTVDVKIADCLNYRLYNEAPSKYAFRDQETYAIGVLNTGRTANPSNAAVLVATRFFRGSSFQLATSVPEFGVQGTARWTSPYAGLTSIWHADVLTSSSDTFETAYSSQPVGFARSDANERRNLVDAFLNKSKTTYKFSKVLSESVKTAATLEEAKAIIDKYLKSKQGGGYQLLDW